MTVFALLAGVAWASLPLFAQGRVFRKLCNYNGQILVLIERKANQRLGQRLSDRRAALNITIVQRMIPPATFAE